MRKPVTATDGLPPSTGVNCRRLIAVSMRRTTRLLIFTLFLTSLRIYERNLNRLLFSYYRGSMLNIQLCDSLGRINTLQISTLFLTKLHDLQNMSVKLTKKLQDRHVRPFGLSPQYDIVSFPVFLRGQITQRT